MNCQNELDFWIYGIIHSMIYNLNERGWSGDALWSTWFVCLSYFPQDLFCFGLLKRDILLVWLFFALPRVFWKENSCHFCVYVALNYWIHCFTIARLTQIKISFRSFSLDKIKKNPKVGFHYRCFSKDKSSQKCNHKPSLIKELVWRWCFFSWKPKSCLHPMVHIVLVSQCFSCLSFWKNKFVDRLGSQLS